jgi:hypothetical protein
MFDVRFRSHPLIRRRSPQPFRGWRARRPGVLEGGFEHTEVNSEATPKPPLIGRRSPVDPVEVFQRRCIVCLMSDSEGLMSNHLS